MIPDIKAVALDVDGVLTDGTFLWDTNGGEIKRFSFRDIMGIARATRSGIKFALISGEKNVIVDRYAAKLEIAHVWQGCKDKAAALHEFADLQSLGLEKICFMGDDINDLPAMQLAGFTAAPGVPRGTEHNGGNGNSGSNTANAWGMVSNARC